MKGKNIVVKDVKCDVSENEPICAKYDIEGFPTIKLIKNLKNIFNIKYFFFMFSWISWIVIKVL